MFCEKLSVRIGFRFSCLEPRVDGMLPVGERVSEYNEMRMNMCCMVEQVVHWPN